MPTKRKLECLSRACPLRAGLILGRCVAGTMTILAITLTSACEAPPRRPDLNATKATSSPSPEGRHVFDIEKTSVVPGIKREVYVRLSAPVTEEVVSQIASTVKAQDPSVYERTFVVFSLPGMRDGQGAWATAFFEPELKVRILGVTLDQLSLAETKKTEPSVDGRKRLGLWIDDSDAGAGSVWEIYELGGKTYADETFKDGGVLTAELRDVSQGRTRKFIVPERTQETGDHMVVTNAGTLEFRDNDGLIRVARRVP